MITTWRLRNFKSIRDAEIPMGPLTVLAGANSSGKSTLIQSILLVSQTSASKVRSRTIVLNGHLTKLGQFDDLVSSDAEGEDSISIGWDCQPRGRTIAEAPPDGAEPVAREGFYRRRGLRVRGISCDISLDVDQSDPQRDLMQLQPRLLSCTLSATARTRAGETTSHVAVKRGLAVPHEKQKHLQLFRRRSGSPAPGLEYDVDLDENSLRELREELTSAEAVGCLFHHFLPARLAVRYDEAEEQARLVASAICEMRPRFPTHVTRQLYTRNISIPGEVVELLRDRLGDSVRPLLEPTTDQPRLLEDTEGAITLRGWYDRVRNLSRAERSAIDQKIQMDDSLADDIANTVKAQRSKVRGSSQYALQLYRPESLSDAISYLDRFFSNSIEYIGPLRDEPKSVYPLAAAEDPSNIGLKGEYTAAVLDLHKERSVRYIPAAHFGQPFINRANSQTTLKEAVLDWLRYMGVADGVETRDLGKLGHELQIVSSGTQQPHDLTHVGVGVSQVLPVLVACLLADNDTTLIFEQPELHLHPRVQTLLADFFLSMALLGKQCIVETHSEYLINRLRFRLASAPKAELTSIVKTYFVEKRDGISRFREVQINQYGAILDWPEGFFDQSQREAENILRAAVNKRKQERAHDQNS